MDRRITALVAAVGTVFVSACATSFPVGGLYTDVNLPVQATSAAGGARTGTASCQSFLGVVATGDCSIAAAKADGGITTVTHADWKANNILGIIGTYTLTVHGN